MSEGYGPQHPHLQRSPDDGHFHLLRVVCMLDLQLSRTSVIAAPCSPASSRGRPLAYETAAACLVERLGAQILIVADVISREADLGRTTKFLPLTRQERLQNGTKY